MHVYSTDLALHGPKSNNGKYSTTPLDSGLVYGLALEFIFMVCIIKTHLIEIY